MALPAVQSVLPHAQSCARPRPAAVLGLHLTPGYSPPRTVLVKGPENGPSTFWATSLRYVLEQRVSCAWSWSWRLWAMPVSLDIIVIRLPQLQETHPRIFLEATVLVCLPLDVFYSLTVCPHRFGVVDQDQSPLYRFCLLLSLLLRDRLPNLHTARPHRPLPLTSGYHRTNNAFSGSTLTALQKR